LHIATAPGETKAQPTEIKGVNEEHSALANLLQIATPARTRKTLASGGL
jgi:hypothetical protein